jgi:hypothetical protein
MNRRELLKLIALGVIGHELDIDRLLWIPGQKTIFIPPETKSLTLSEIVAIDLERMAPMVRRLFERDDMFYRLISVNGKLEWRPE